MSAPVVDALGDFLVPIDSVSAHPQNARTHDLDAIAGSLADHDQYLPIIVQASTGHIVAGNGTWKAARQLGWTAIAALVLELDDAAALAYLLADNRTGETGRYDEAILAEALSTLPTLEGTGYDPFTLNRLLDSLKVSDLDAEAGDDRQPTPDAAADYLNSEQRRLVLVLPAECAERVMQALDESIQGEETRGAAVARLASQEAARAANR